MIDTGFTINESFKTQFITGMLSSPLLYIPHFHYSYIDQALQEIFSQKDGYNILGLDKECIVEFGVEGTIIKFSSKVKVTDATFEKIIGTLIDEGCLKDENGNPSSKCIFLIKNSYSKLQELKCQRLLQTFAGKYERGELRRETTIIFVSPEPMESLPEQVEKLFTVIEMPRPQEKDIKDYIKKHLPISNQFKSREDDLTIEMTRTLQGLQHYEIEQIIQSSSVRTGGKLTELSIRYALEEKKNLVKKSGIIEVVDTDISFEDVGGLENLREDLKQKAKIFHHLSDISSVKLPLPKGVLILGMPGCGKSLIAKSIANEFGVSLLRLDINRLMGQYVGQSEANLRKALSTAEAAHPCVLWIDEIEKAFAGANGGVCGSNNDIVMRLMGHFLTWMQERKTVVYIVATANDVMRPEFMRKGRFDEVYFVDFPNKEERIDILKKKIQYFQKNIDQQKVFGFNQIDDNAIDTIAGKMQADVVTETFSNGFSGSEIESVVNAVMEKCYLKYIELEAKDRHTIEITIHDFEDEINKIKSSIMSNQKSKPKNGIQEKTSVERIQDLQTVYQFRTASRTTHK